MPIYGLNTGSPNPILMQNAHHLPQPVSPQESSPELDSAGVANHILDRGCTNENATTGVARSNPLSTSD